MFFVDLGAKILFDWDLLTDVLPYAIAMTVGIAVFQVLSAGLAARYTGRMNFAESLMIGFGMLGRAELAFVVIDIAYVQNKTLLNRIKQFRSISNYNSPIANFASSVMLSCPHGGSKTMSTSIFSKPLCLLTMLFTKSIMT